MKPLFGNRWKELRRGNRSALRSRRAVVESLEDRRLLSGLTLVVNDPRSIVENAGASATTATVTRVDLDTSQSLTVSLASNDTTEATVAASVTIPAGQTSYTFPINAVDDALLDGPQTVTITASASTGGTAANLANDDTFGSAGRANQKFHTEAVALQPDGKVVAAGFHYTGITGNEYDFGIARHTASGAVDTTFNGTGTVFDDLTGAPEQAQAIAVQPDGKIVVAGKGKYNVTNGYWNFLLARYLPDGSRDSSFGTGGVVKLNATNAPSEIQDVYILSDGKILAGGSGPNGFQLARFTSSGELDATFGSGGITGAGGGYGTAMGVAADGKIVLAGLTGPGNSNATIGVVRFTESGQLDTSFDSDGLAIADLPGDYDSARDVAVQPDGKIVVAGYSSPPGVFPPQHNFVLTRFNSNGSRDLSFGSSGFAVRDFLGDDQAWAVAVAPDGKILAAGQAGAYKRSTIARFSASGTFESSLSASTSDTRADDIAIAPDGRVFTGSWHIYSFPAEPGFVSAYRNPMTFTASDTLEVRDYETLEVVFDKSSLAIGGDRTLMTVTRNNTDVDAPLSVQMNYEHASELVMPGFVTIPAGQQSVTVAVSTTDNGIVEGTRTVRVWAQATGYVSGAEQLEIREEGVLGLPVGVDGYATDHWRTGTFDALDTTSNDVFISYYVSALSGESRGLFEFDLSSLDAASVIDAASITFHVFQKGVPPDSIVKFYGYLGDGALTLDDATVEAVELGQLSLSPGIEGLRRYGVPLDAAFLQAARAQGGRVGIRAQTFTLEPYTSTTLRVYSSEHTLVPESSRPMFQLVLSEAPQNSAPVADSQSVATDEDVPLDIVLTASDDDGDGLRYAVVAGPAHGTLSGTAPNLTYTPDADYHGDDSFTFKANDGIADSNVATVAISVAPVNDPPVANDTSATTDEDTAVSFTLPATDVEGDPLVYRVVTSPSHGWLTLQGSTATYRPFANYNGTDSFTFKAVDGQGQGAESNVATVSIDVLPVNDPPVAQNGSYAMYHDRTINLLLQASDVDKDPLTYTIVTQPSHGTLVVNDQSGRFVSYTPDPGYVGEDALTFKANDGAVDSNVATVSLRITLVNPSAYPTVGVYDENDVQPNTVDYVAAGSSLTNTEFAAGVSAAYDQDFGGVLEASALAFKWSYGVRNAKALDITRAEGTNYGVGSPGSAALPISKTGVYVTSDLEQSNYNYLSLDFGAIENAALREHVVEFGLTVLSSPGVDYGTVTVTGRLAEGGAMSASRPINDGYGTGDTFYGLTAPAGDYFTGFSLSYDAAVNKPLWFDDLGFRTATVNHPPVADDQAVTVNEDGSAAIVLTGSDADGDSLTYTVVAGPAHGTLSGAAPNLLYTPAADYNGPDSFTFKVNDGQADSDVATVAITVTPVNDAPAATVSGPTSAMRGQSTTFTFGAGDLSDGNPAGQQFLYSITWDDGTSQTVSGGYSVQVEHVFASVRPSGTYAVTATVTDEAGAGLTSAAASASIEIYGAEMQGGDLVVVGTSGSDSIQIQPAQTKGSLWVLIGGESQGDFRPSGWITVYALGGDDTVQVQSAKIGKKTVSVNVPAAIFGAEGNDVLETLGSRASNILVGGDGDDTITAGGGRDLVFGGLGADTLRGGAADDILVAGVSAYDANLVALRAIWDEWTRTDVKYSTRVGHLDGTIAGGRNGGYYLTASDVSDDAAVDQLFGESGTDWFFCRSSGDFKDVFDRKRNEEITPLDP